MKLYLIVFCLTHRSVPCLVVLRETFSGSKFRDSQSDVMIGVYIVVLLWVPLYEDWRTCNKWTDCRNQRGWRTHGPLNQLSRAHMNSQWLKQQAMDCMAMHQDLCLHIITVPSSFYGKTNNRSRYISDSFTCS